MDRVDEFIRSSFGHCILPRTEGMTKLEEELQSHALMGRVDDDKSTRPHVSPAMLLEALQIRSGVHRDDIKIRVTAVPDDFFIRFRSSDDCSRVLHSCQRILVHGGTVIFRRWHRGVGSPTTSRSSLDYYMKFSFDGLPQEAWHHEAVSNLVNKLGGVLVKIGEPCDSYCLPVEAWMKDPAKLPKVYHVELPEPDDAESPLSLTSRTKLRTIRHIIYIHIDSVKHHDSNTCRTFNTYAGRADGQGPCTSSDGGRVFRGPGGQGQAGGLA